jgi:hypothetical protein
MIPLTAGEGSAQPCPRRRAEPSTEKRRNPDQR